MNALDAWMVCQQAFVVGSTNRPTSPADTILGSQPQQRTTLFNERTADIRQATINLVSLRSRSAAAATVDRAPGQMGGLPESRYVQQSLQLLCSTNPSPAANARTVQNPRYNHTKSGRRPGLEIESPLNSRTAGSPSGANN